MDGRSGELFPRRGSYDPIPSVYRFLIPLSKKLVATLCILFRRNEPYKLLSLSCFFFSS